MNRNELQKLAEMRYTEAKTLLQAGCYQGAYYLAGYAIECALKACIAKQIVQYEFPDRVLANNAWSHNLERLIGTAELEYRFRIARRKNQVLEANWSVVKDWNESSRYDITISKAKAGDLFQAGFAKDDGILGWIKEQW